MCRLRVRRLRRRKNWDEQAYLPPDVERKFEADDQNALVQLSGSVAEGMFTSVFVEAALRGVVIGGIVSETR